MWAPSSKLSSSQAWNLFLRLPKAALPHGMCQVWSTPASGPCPTLCPTLCPTSHTTCLLELPSLCLSSSQPPHNNPHPPGPQMKAKGGQEGWRDPKNVDMNERAAMKMMHTQGLG